MNIFEVEKSVKSILEDINKNTFIYDFLRAYDFPKASITRLRNGELNLSKNDDDILWKKKLYYKAVNKGSEDLHVLIDQVANDDKIMRSAPRFLVVTDFETLLAKDTKTQDTLDCPLNELDKHAGFFGPWAGMEKTQGNHENPADVKAAEKMAKLYDLIRQDNEELYSDEASLHKLNVFLSRLLFCYFAEDTEIFPDNQFSDTLANYTQDDGSDLQAFLERLFEALNTPPTSSKNDKSEALNFGPREDFPDYLKAFPYVNGGLFAHDIHAPEFSRRSRDMLIECGRKLDWSEINPDIFGSMIQAVVHPGQRSTMGMHYTSVTNIMKVIEPLFLNELKEEFEKYKDNEGKLKKLLDRLHHIKIFDPACGSGNFLVIAYKELRKLEMDIFEQLQSLRKDPELPMSRIFLNQFYGIELDDFACEVATLSLWLAEHQMNVQFEASFGQSRPSLPLKESGKIVHGNATRLDWEEVCPKDEVAEIYILGNPPYVGGSIQTIKQKEDMAYVFKEISGYKNLDYISCWFLKACRYVVSTENKLAFVSTNSICQGEQVNLIWPEILSFDLEIFFAHQSFKWTNSAKGKAGVTCCIIGICPKKTDSKILYNNSSSITVKNISPYLYQGKDIIIKKRSQPISELPSMGYGSKPVDGGHLILSKQDRDNIIKEYPFSKDIFKRLIGSVEFIRGLDRWCLWIEGDQQELAFKIPPIKEKIERVRKTRMHSTKIATVERAQFPHEFGEIRHKNTNSIIIPSVSSEQRKYIPIGYLNADTVISNSAHLISNPEPYIFAVISSRMHMTWVRTVAGRLETRIRYSSALCYNTFPIPPLSDIQKDTLTEHVYNVLGEREKHPEKTMAQLYDPDKMPDGLRAAHHALDLEIEKCYRSKPFTSDEERLEHLFKLYEKMIAAEQQTKNTPKAKIQAAE